MYRGSSFTAYGLIGARDIKLPYNKSLELTAGAQPSSIGEGLAIRAMVDPDGAADQLYVMP